jgi:nicotinamidase-related amidase
MTDDDRDWGSFALLLIDVQKDFWTDEMKIAFPDFEENVTRLLALCRREGIGIVHLRAKFRKDKSDWMVRYLFRDSIPCVAGTAGAKHFDFAAEAGDEPVIIKQTFDGFLNPELSRTLEAAGKRYVLVAGLVTSVCVLLTAAAAAQRGYLVSVVEDSCADTPEAHIHTLERYPFVFDPVTSDSIVDHYDKWSGQLTQLPER